MRYLYAFIFIIISIVYMVIIYKVVNKKIKNKVLNCVLDVILVFIFSFSILALYLYFTVNNSNRITVVLYNILNTKIVPSYGGLLDIRGYIDSLPCLYSLAVSIKKFDKALTTKTVIGTILSILCFVISLKI